MAKNFHFFKKNCHWQFCWKNDNFYLFFFLCQVFGNFLTFKWLFSGGSGTDKLNDLKKPYILCHFSDLSCSQSGTPVPFSSCDRDNIYRYTWSQKALHVTNCHFSGLSCSQSGKPVPASSCDCGRECEVRTAICRFHWFHVASDL